MSSDIADLKAQREDIRKHLAAAYKTREAHRKRVAYQEAKRKAEPSRPEGTPAFKRMLLCLLMVSNYNWECASSFYQRYRWRWRHEWIPFDETRPRLEASS